MKKVNSFLETKLAPIAVKVGTQRHLLAVRNGMLFAMPLIIIGSFFLILSSLPFPNYAEWLASHWDLGTWFNKIVNGSFGLMGLVASFGVAYNLAKSYKLDGVAPGIISLSSFLILTPEIVDKNEVSGFGYTYLGSGGLFVAIIVGIVSVEIYKIFIRKNIVIKMPETVPPEVSRSFSSLIPGFVIIAVFAIIQKVLEVSDLGNAHVLITNLLGGPLSLIGSSLLGTIVVVIITSLFWLCGIHGADVVGSVLYPIWYMNSYINRVAFQAGEAIPHIVSYPFMMNFVYMGGGGATLGLVIAIVLFGKSKQSKLMGGLTLAPGIFNINEPLMFGLPIVMNPMMFIPYILVPVMNVLICYLSMASGLVAKAVGINVGWTVPPIISGYLATGGHISGSILQIIVLLLDVIVYMLFFKIYDNQLLQEEAISEAQ